LLPVNGGFSVSTAGPGAAVLFLAAQPKGLSSFVLAGGGLARMTLPAAVETLPASGPVGDEQPNQSARTLPLAWGRAAERQVLDRVFANLQGSVLADGVVDDLALVRIA